MLDNSPNKHLKKGVIWTLLNRTSVIAMQFIAMVVLARFLTPSDFAIVGIAMFFIVISQTLLDSGMGGALLRKKNIEDVDYSTQFIFNMGVGVIMYSLLLIFSKPIASFYNNEELSLIISIIGLSILISAFGKIQNVLLLRELNFKVISIIAIVSSSISLLVAVIMAMKGYGVWALVMQNLINNTLVVLLQFLYNRFFPRMRFSLLSFKEQWSFGSHLLYSQLLNTAYQNVFLLIFPKISSLNFAGLYTQANKIQQIPWNIANSVVSTSAFPVLAKIEDEKLFVQTNKDFTRKVYIVSFAVFFALSVFSKQIIEILLGAQWIDAAPILSILSIGGIGAVAFMLVRNALKSMGITNRIFKIEVFRAVIGIAMLMITFTLGNYYILAGIVFASFLSCIVAMYYLSKVSKFTMKEQVMDFIISLLPIAPSAIALYLFVHYTTMGSILTLLCGLPIFVLLVVLFGNIFRNNEIKQTQKLFLARLRARGLMLNT
jgi:O-antigen/teichoic acid export membrane protein